MKAGRRVAGWAGSVAAALLLLPACPPARLPAQASRLPAQRLDSLPNSGKLWDPNRAGRPLPPVGARDNTDAIQAVEKRMRCTCGCQLDIYTCRTTDFTCETSPAMHQRVMTLSEQGKSGPEIVDAFVKDNGVSILMAPPKHGFNLAGYFMPSILILTAAVVLIVVLRRWTRTAATLPAHPATRLPAPASPDELERLRRALRQEPD
jgi:cytochrome c-type biogenesis protein CcmH/NrfF